MKKILIFILFALMFTVSVNAQILSQWRGPDRTGVYPETGLLTKWPAGGPALAWKNENIGNGHASAAVTKDKVYVTGEVDGQGTFFAFDLNGKLLWKSVYGPEFTESYPGSRSTPTIAHDYIYLTTGLGMVYCLDSSNGKTVWSLNFLDKFDGQNLRWALAESPLVYDNKVIVTPGGSKGLVVALDRYNGKTLWACTGLNEQSAYASPTLVNHNGQKLLLTMTQNHLVCIDPQNGNLLWSDPHQTRYNIQPNTPWYQNGFVFYSTGYGSGSVKLKLSTDGKSYEKLWENEDLDSQLHGFIVTDGYVYGAGQKRDRWYCINWTNGATEYESRELLSKGNVIMADGLLYCYTEKGEFALVKPNPKQFDVISQFEITLGTDQHWAHPVIKDGKLYVRHGQALMVYNIAR